MASQDQQFIISRQILRHKLRFWRLLTIIIVVISLVSLLTLRNDSLWVGPHIARIDITGLIQDDEQLVEQMDYLSDDPEVKAVIISISSPGGTTYGGEKTYEAVKRLAQNKPVIADIRTLAASAGYMIALGADHIIAGETSIVGSIGVIFQYAQVSELLDKIGVSFKEIKSSPLKAEPSPFHPASDEAVAMINAMVINTYDWFIDLVVENRNLKRDEVLKLADGSIFTGRQSLENGLIDEIGGTAQIRAYLQDQGLSDELIIIDRNPVRPSDSLFGSSLPGFAREFLQLDGPLKPEWLKNQKLFLDGLLSFWQFGS